jgi:NAD(P)H-dependent flavin oxidoreductase YrpB (nitropropane dioxygenase family)
VDRVDLLGLKEDNVEVGRCEGYLLIAHGSKKHPKKWNLNGACAIGGFVGCYPGLNQPNDELENSRSRFVERIGAPDNVVWPNVAQHEDLMLDGPLGRNMADGTSDGDPENEHNFRQAIKNALNGKNEVIEKLCKCCDEVKITIDIQDDGTVKEAINAVNKELGTSLTAGKNTTKHTCSK